VERAAPTVVGAGRSRALWASFLWGCAGLAVIYAIGATRLAVVTDLPLAVAVAQGILIFVLFGLIKVALAVLVAVAAAPAIIPSRYKGGRRLEAYPVSAILLEYTSRREKRTTGGLFVETQVARRRFTVEDYHRMAEAGILHEADRVELVWGEIVEMTLIGSRDAMCVIRLNRLLAPLVREDALVSHRTR
jgi:hypothetical protein